MISFSFFGSDIVRDMIGNALVSPADFQMIFSETVYDSNACASALRESGALIVQGSFPACRLQELMMDLEIGGYRPAILFFDIHPDGYIFYSLSNELYDPRAIGLANYFETILGRYYPCRRMYWRSAPTSHNYGNTVHISTARQDALEELLLGCTSEEVGAFKQQFKFDFRENGYYLYFWELNFNAYQDHWVYKDVYNMLGQKMKTDCERILVKYGGGEFFYMKLTQACIIINDLDISSESRRRSELNELLKELFAITASRSSICYLSEPIRRIEDFRFAYDNYLANRDKAFFLRDNTLMRASLIQKIKRETNAVEINNLLNSIVRYISYDISNHSLDTTLKELFLDVLKHSMNLPMYYYCASVISSSLSLVDNGAEHKEITSWLNSNHLRHSSIEEIHAEVHDWIQAIRFRQGRAKQTRSTLAMKTIEYIQQHYQENIQVSQIAEALFISDTYLCRVFKKTLNMSVLQYLIQYRIERAKFLLEKTDYPIYTVAERSGFQDARHFSKTFKKITGTTPSEYRKNS